MMLQIVAKGNGVILSSAGFPARRKTSAVESFQLSAMNLLATHRSPLVTRH